MLNKNCCWAMGDRRLPNGGPIFMSTSKDANDMSLDDLPLSEP